MSSFPSDEEFNQRVLIEQIADSAIKWGELPINVVYRIQKLVWISRYGRDAVLQLVNRENKEVNVWAPVNAAADYTLKSLGNEEAYIRSLGQKESKSGDKKRKHPHFETVYISRHARCMHEFQAEVEKVEDGKKVKVTDGGRKMKTLAPEPTTLEKLSAKKIVKKRPSLPVSLLEEEASQGIKHSKVDIDRLISGSGIIIE